MFRWSTSHNIPFDFHGHPDNALGSSITSTIINNTIWLVVEYYDNYDDKVKHQIAVFDPTTFETIKLDCEIPGQDGIRNIASQGDQLYIVTDDGMYNNNIYQFDTKTTKLTNFLNVHARFRGSLRVVGDKMYTLAENDDRIQVVLITINLSDKAVERKVLVEKNERCHYELLHINEEFYMFTRTNHEREVFLIDKNVELQKLVLMQPNHPPLTHDWVEDCNITQPSLFTFGNYNLEYIDFNTNQWKTTAIEEIKNSNFDRFLKSGEKIDDKIYVVFQLVARSMETVHYEIKVLDLEPKLVDICLLQLIEELVSEKDENKLENILEDLAIPLRQKFINMIEWRKGG